MSERLERLQREIALEKAAVLAELGLAFDGPLLITGQASVEAAIRKRLARIPEVLRADAESRLRRVILVMPWLSGRDVGRCSTDMKSVGLPSASHQNVGRCSANEVPAGKEESR